jgi:serine/threonine protein kinase
MKGGGAKGAEAFAPAGTELALHLGVGTVFEVALVRDENGRELVCKRAATGAHRTLGERALERERAILVAAKSPQLVELVAFGHDARGAFVLEAAARGKALRDLVDAELDDRAWLELARATSEALAKLHAHRDASGELLLVHGDISPDNIFFDPPSHVTFLDLSNATFRDASDPIFENARGTLPYVAPEVARGEARPTRESDVYALAATLLAVLLGGSLTQATTEASRLLEVGSSGVDGDRIDRRAGLPVRARRAIARALRFDPSERLVSSAELAEELREAGGPPVAPDGTNR